MLLKSKSFVEAPKEHSPARQLLEFNDAISDNAQAEIESDEIATLKHASDIYEFESILGKGSFGKVYQTVYKPTGEKIAVKVSVSPSLPLQSNLLTSFIVTDAQKLVKFKKRGIDQARG